jgi:hypothetical protein
LRLLFWTAAACCAVGQVMIVIGTVRASLDGSGSGEPRTTTVPRPRRWSEIAWSAAPAIGLALVLTLTWRAMLTPVSSTGHQHGGSAPVEESK